MESDESFELEDAAFEEDLIPEEEQMLELKQLPIIEDINIDLSRFQSPIEEIEEPEQFEAGFKHLEQIQKVSTGSCEKLKGESSLLTKTRSAALRAYDVLRKKLEIGENQQERICSRILKIPNYEYYNMPILIACLLFLDKEQSIKNLNKDKLKDLNLKDLDVNEADFIRYLRLLDRLRI